MDDWLEARIAGVREQAEGKRAEHRLAVGMALRDRGGTQRDITGLTGVGEKLRDLIRYAEQSASAAKADPPDATRGRAERSRPGRRGKGEQTSPAVDQ